MAQVIITKSLQQKIEKLFKKDSISIFELFLTLQENPFKGKLLGVVSDIAIKEIRYNKYRFYFILHNSAILFIEQAQLKDIIIKFVEMSEKKDQQHTIDSIKHILRNIGKDGFS